jgi:protein-tyrosine phosphatase
MFNFFKKSKEISEYLTSDLGVYTDMHSHLLPGIDDGVQTLEESIANIQLLAEMGIKKIITTPHVMSDFYKNTPDIISRSRDLVKQKLDSEGIVINFEAAAEYYLDETFHSKTKQKEQILTFGDKYVLFEMSFVNESPFINETVYNLQMEGYKPILAHPERYAYFQSDFEKVEYYFDRGIYFQININSISGYYSKAARVLVEKLIDKQMVHFIGTDAHNSIHIYNIENCVKMPYFKKLSAIKLLNNEL